MNYESICQSCKEEESMVPGNDVACPRAAEKKCYGNGRTESGWYRSCCRECSWALNQCQMCGSSLEFAEQRGSWRTYRVTFRVADTGWRFRHIDVDARNTAECLKKATALIGVNAELTVPASLWVIVDLTGQGSGYSRYTPVVYVAPENTHGG